MHGDAGVGKSVLLDFAPYAGATDSAVRPCSPGTMMVTGGSGLPTGHGSTASDGLRKTHVSDATGCDHAAVLVATEFTASARDTSYCGSTRLPGSFRIGRSLAYKLANEYLGTDGATGVPCSGSARGRRPIGLVLRLGLQWQESGELLLHRGTVLARVA